MIIAIGSLNPTKIQAAQNVCKKLISPDVQIIGVATASQVSDQPMSDDETYRGAMNRAKAALAASPQAIYGIGIEGGLSKRSYGWFEASVAVVIDRDGRSGIGSSGGIILPDSIISLVESGYTLEQAIDTQFHTQQIGKGIGMFGIMTNSFVTRTTGMEHGIAFAFARFLHKEVFEK